MKRKSLKPLVPILGAGAIALGVAACGSSSKAAGVALAPAGGPTVATASATPPATTPTTATTPATPAVATPASGPLAHEPHITLPTGPSPRKLVTKDIITGHGQLAKKGDTVSVNYVGELYSSGKIFDASWRDNPGKATTFPLTSGPGGVIAGWVDGIPGMRVGGRRELIIPPNLAYGKQGNSGIPANSTLIFVVDLLKVTH